MQVGFIGLGRMGADMVDRLMDAGHSCVVFDVSASNVQASAAKGAEGATSLDDLLSKLATPCAVWIMVPSGRITESVATELIEKLTADDVIVDGGNSNYQDSVRRAALAAAKGIHFLDVGTSGGVWGRERGYCLMIGGDAQAAERLDAVFRSLAPGRGEIAPTPGRENKRSTAEQGYLYCGPSGAGHFVKMVHNGIEYGVMQAYAEGFDILFNARKTEIPAERRYELDLAEVAEVWRRGSVIGSWLLDLTSIALAQDNQLSKFSGQVADSGEGRWTLQAAIEEGVPAEVIAASLFARFRSRIEATFADKVLSAMRFQFGGHVEQAPATQ